jgi:hypothetical protein
MFIGLGRAKTNFIVHGRAKTCRAYGPGQAGLICLGIDTPLLFLIYTTKNVDSVPFDYNKICDTLSSTL